MDVTNEKYLDMLRNMTNLMEVAPWIMQVKENGDGVVLVLQERQKDDNGQTVWHKWGEIAWSKVRSCKEPIRYILSGVLDSLGNPLGLQALISSDIAYRGDVPLNREAGTKMALIAILTASVQIELKIELLGWRIERFSAEEAFYWFGKATIPVYGKKAMNWSVIGMRTMLAGPTDQKVKYDDLLEKLRR